MKRPPEVLTADEADAILKQPNRRALTGLRNRAMLELMYRAGLRVSEVVNLKPQHVRLGKARVEVRNSKGGKGRNVHLRQSTVEILEQWIASRPKSDWFFSSCYERGGIASGRAAGAQLSVQYVQAMVKRYARRAGVERRVTPHVFRHTAATDWLADGFTIREVQSLLGHADLGSTQVYLHVHDDAIAAKMAALA